MSKKIYELYGSDQRVIDNLKRKIRGYEKMKKDITSQNRKVNNQNRKLQQENKKYKEVINKAKKWVKNQINYCTIEANSTTTDTMCRITIVGLNNLLDILKEVEHEKN